MVFDRNAYQRDYMRRRRAVARGVPIDAPEQHAAHVAAWSVTLTAMQRLEHRSFVRRCLMEARRR